MKHRFLLYILLILTSAISLQGLAQVEIIGDEKVQSMLRQRVASVDTVDLEGYRIQLFFGNNRSQAQQMKARFNMRYAEWSDESYLLYYDPNWRFRIGNFYRKIDAQPMMMMLQRDFGNVFLIRDKIELPSLRNNGF